MKERDSSSRFPSLFEELPGSPSPPLARSSVDVRQGRLASSAHVFLVSSHVLLFARSDRLSDLKSVVRRCLICRVDHHYRHRPLGVLEAEAESPVQSPM
jgi:hypothetical protein